jgi:hypothetical protein
MRCELLLRAINLPNVEGALRKSDPFAVVTHIATTPGERPKCLGRTEEIENELSPRWQHIFRFEWNLGTPMVLDVSIYDRIGKKKYKTMGSMEFDVAHVLCSPGCHHARNLRNGGVLVAYIRKGTGSGSLRLKLKGCHLRNVEGYVII